MKRLRKAPFDSPFQRKEGKLRKHERLPEPERLGRTIPPPSQTPPITLSPSAPAHLASSRRRQAFPHYCARPPPLPSQSSLSSALTRPARPTLPNMPYTHARRFRLRPTANVQPPFLPRAPARPAECAGGEARCCARKRMRATQTHARVRTRAPPPPPQTRARANAHAHARSRAHSPSRAHTAPTRRHHIVRSHGSVTCVPAPEPSFGGLGQCM